MSEAIQQTDAAAAPADTVLDRLLEVFDDLAPQQALAARYLLDNPSEIALQSMRAIAREAQVKPNTLVRLAHAIGFDSYEDLREPFRQQAMVPAPTFPDRARFLQSLDEGGRHGELLTEMAESALTNVEALYAGMHTADLMQAGEWIARSRRTNVMGVGTAAPLAQNFAYVAGMAVDHIQAIPTIGLAVDDIARMRDEDVLLTMTFSPYRTEIVEATRAASDRGIRVIAVTDSRASPIARLADLAFVVPMESPFPFSSNVATTALLETLLAFVVAEARAPVDEAIEQFHANRRNAGIYLEQD